MTRKRMLALAAVVLLLVAAVDFRQRVYVPREFKARGEGSMVPAVVAAPRTAAQIQKDLSAWLPKLRPVAAGAGSSAQTDWALTLLAVFSDRDNSFAVVRAASAAGGAAKVQSVAMGDTLYGFTVTRIEPLKLVLISERGEQELQLFKPAAASAMGARPPSRGLAPSPAASAAAAPRPGFVPAQAQQRMPAQEPGPVAPSQGGAKAAAGEGWKPGAPVQLPESMRGLEIVEAPVPTEPPKVRKSSKAQPKAPQNP